MYVRSGALAPALSLALALAAGPAAAECPSGRPVLNGPVLVQTGRSYSVSWTSVFSQPGTSDYYLLQRSPDPTFASKVDQISTTRPAQTLPAAPLGVNVLYHRVVVQTSCAGASPAILTSNVLTTRFTSDCDTPGAVGDISITPAEPPAFTTYVLTWDTGVGGPGPGGSPQNLTYRLRRTSSFDVRESTSIIGNASFADAPGTYVYEVRAESSCGTVGPWSAPLTVRVGGTPTMALAVVTQPAPVAALNPAAPPAVTFTVRNTGTAPLAVSARSAYNQITVAPDTFSLAPYETKALTATFNSLVTGATPFHATVVLSSEGAAVAVPIDVAVGTTSPALPVSFSDTDIDIDAQGTAVLRSISNPGTVPATVVGSINVPWLVVESVDGSAWDRMLDPGEVRVIRIRVDRARRRADTGTEVAAVTLLTAGHAQEPQVLRVVDDGPNLPVLTGPRPDPTGSKTRLLYASMPNNRDALNAGRFASDLWLANLDPLSPIDVTLFLTPLGGDSRQITYSFATRLQGGETRRYRNIVQKVLGVDGACEVEARSPAPTLTATALINNTPLAPVSSPSPLRPMGTSSTLAGQYGFEMRPTRPGEGARFDDQIYVVSGVAHNASRRTNLLLTETSGYDTRVEIQVFDAAGNDVTLGGKPISEPVSALGTVQVNDSVLLDPAVNYPGSLWVKVKWYSGTLDAFGNQHGSVVPFATVIDNNTQDASLRVGVSTTALDPTPPATSAARTALGVPGSVPFGGGPAPLLFPVAHLLGAPLGSGALPYWRTRVTFTNTTDRNSGESRGVLLSFYDQMASPDTPPRTLRLALQPGGTFTIDDLLGSQIGFGIPESVGSYGPVTYEVTSDGSSTWKDIDVQTETYTLDTDTSKPVRGQYATGMEGFSYRHGYSSFQSNLGTVQIDGAENSSRYRTNLILEEVGGATCTVAISAYLPGSFVPIMTVGATVPPFGYVSKELFKGWLGLDLTELSDVRVVVRQIDGDGVFMAFASRIDLGTGDPANVFLRPALAGTGR